MAKSIVKLIKPDRSRIDLSDDFQVRHWTKKLGVSKEELRSSVDKVGPVVKSVEKELGRLDSEPAV